MRTSPATSLPCPRRIAAAAAWILLLAAGCGSTAERPVRPEFDLHDPSATRRAKAVSVVAVSGDVAFVPALIPMLDDGDPSVRLAAGKALKDLTGHDSGYRASAPPEERRRQVEEWRTYWARRPGAAAGDAPLDKAPGADAPVEKAPDPGEPLDGARGGGPPPVEPAVPSVPPPGGEPRVP